MPIDLLVTGEETKLIDVVLPRADTERPFEWRPTGSQACSYPYSVPGLMFQHYDTVTTGYYWAIAIRHWVVVGVSLIMFAAMLWSNLKCANDSATEDDHARRSGTTFKGSLWGIKRTAAVLLAIGGVCAFEYVRYQRGAADARAETRALRQAEAAQIKEAINTWWSKKVAEEQRIGNAVTTERTDMADE